MADTHVQHVLELLQAIPRKGLSAVKQLFWSELNYDRANDPLPTRTWPPSARAVLAEAPRLLAQHDSAAGTFDIVHIVLNDRQRGRDFPLSIAAERQVVAQLFENHPYALFLFSDAEARHWHFVNVKYRRENGAEAGTRAVIRRISVGPDERLRTAAERIAMLDLAALTPDLFGLSPLAIQQRHDAAFDVERVTQDFFTTYRRIFERAEALIAGITDADALRIFTQRLFNRLLFIVFLERKGWLTFNGRTDYLQALWASYRQGEIPAEDNFYRDRLKLLFFCGLNNSSNTDVAGIHRKGPISERIGQVPYLNGGLFEREALDERDDIVVPDAIFAQVLHDLLYHYNFTVTESTPLDVEVAVDPEMLGRIFEELVTGRHETGSYYTPKPVVAFMCREALKGYLQDTCPREDAAALTAFVDSRDAAGLRNPERVLAALQTVRACDPACGSGAYLLGMLHELVDLRQALFSARRIDAKAVYEKKLEIIQTSLYGVDIDPFAVNIARLRLWLSLIVDFAGDTPPPLPNLEFKIEAGDSLTAPAPMALQPDLFHHQLVNDYFALKSEFMTAHGPDKQRLRAQIATTQQEIAAWAGTAGDPDAFDWTVAFAEIFTAPGESAATLTGSMTGVVNAGGQMQLATRQGRAPGFDIVVANPPYVRQELLAQVQKQRFKTVYPEVYRGTADLYVYFYARALQLLREGGIASFISSNKWLRAGYGKKLRAHLAERASVEAVIDFGDLPLFTATAYPMIIVFRKAPPAQAQALRALEVEDLAVVNHLPEVVAAEAWDQPQSSLRADGWTLVEPEVRLLLRKLRERGKPLGEYVDGQLYYGIKTGYNRAFVIDQATCDRLVAEDPKSGEVIKPWLRGRDIKRWRVDSAGLYLAYIPWDFEIEESPAVYKYLEGYRQRLARRPEVRDGRFPWYALSRYGAEYADEFLKPKIIYPHFSEAPNFAYDESGSLGNDKTYIIPNVSFCLLGFLNSCVIEFILRQICPAVRGGYMELRTIYIEQLPIPESTPAQREAIEALVQQLLDAEGQGPQVAAWERELNALVYEVYGLTPEEIALVERETAG